MTEPELTVILVPDGAGNSRTYKISYKRLRILRGLGVGLATVVVFLAATWGWMAAQAAHAVRLETEVAALRADHARYPVLLRQLNELEQQYDDLRSLFAPTGEGAPSELWLPPPGSLRTSSARDEGSASRPDSWPLTERGFVTQGLLAANDTGHPGLDIAIPTGSYVRAAGSGHVLDVGEDPTYGRYVRIDHGNGYETLYAHASLTVVRLGEEVRKNEVIALTGSTGRSTAPHLHFEILLDGEAVDPLDLVRQP